MLHRFGQALFASLAIVLAACTATTSGTGAPPPAAGGLGANATGGLLAAPDTTAAPGATPVRMEGRLLDGPYVPLLNKEDFARAQQAALTAFESTPSGQTTIWRNPTNGHWGTLTPTRTYENADGRYCRDYRQTITLGGQEHQGNGTACREPDAVWHIVS